MRKFLIILTLLPTLLFAQEGGSYSFQSLALVNNARTAALGGYNVTLSGDAALFGQNPALLDSAQIGDAVFMYNPFFVDINAVTGQYVAEVGKLGKFAFGITYVGYGDFTQRDPTGAESGEFGANDYVMTVGKSHRLGPFVLGANVKFIHSGIAGYTANAMAFDLGGMYQLPNSDFTAGMVISNFGFVLSDYTGEQSNIPLNVQLGMSFRPEGMPIRFSVTGHNLTDQNASFFDADEKPNFADEIFKRVSIGGEVLFSKNVNFLLGYDHGRKRELRLDQTAGGSGFSYGVMIKVKKYTFRFSRATYQAAGGTSFISLQTNLKDLNKAF